MERVLIAFDRDEAGDRGATKVAERMMARGVECLRVNFPHGQDANEYALKVAPPEQIPRRPLESGGLDGQGQGPCTAAVRSLCCERTLSARPRMRRARPLFL